MKIFQEVKVRMIGNISIISYLDTSTRLNELFGLFFCNSKYWIDAEGDEIELARGNETVGLEEENSLWQFITMLDKNFDTGFGLVKLFIEEPVEPSAPFTVRNKLGGSFFNH